jgi:hypothetical protein
LLPVGGGKGQLIYKTAAEAMKMNSSVAKTAIDIKK